MPLNKPFKFGQAVKAVKSQNGNETELSLDNGFVLSGFYNDKLGTWVLMIRDGNDYYERHFDSVVFQ